MGQPLIDAKQLDRWLYDPDIRIEGDVLYYQDAPIAAFYGVPAKEAIRQILARRRALGAMLPLPVSEQLPERTQPGYGAGLVSVAVLAYDTEAGWIGAHYGPTTHGDVRWYIEAAGVSGHEWETERLDRVTHWMPYPPAPGEVK